MRVFRMRWVMQTLGAKCAHYSKALLRQLVLLQNFLPIRHALCELANVPGWHVLKNCQNLLLYAALQVLEFITAQAAANDFIIGLRPPN